MRDKEGYRGIGRKARRQMLRMWHADKTKMTLKQWATGALVGELAFAWLQHKRHQG